MSEARRMEPLEGKDAAFAELMRLRGRGPAVAGEVEMDGADPLYRTPIHVGETVAAVLAGLGVAVDDLWEMQGHARQRVQVDVAHAAATVRTGTTRIGRRRMARSSTCRRRRSSRTC